MSYIEGSTIEIFCEIPADKVSGTTLTLESLVDPNGTDWATSQTLSPNVSITNLFSVVWQSTEGTHPVGRYEYIIKSLNGARENFGKGSFFLVEQ